MGDTCCFLLTFPFQLHAAQEDTRNSEARWGSTLSRYRMKIQSLEAENQELKEDLKMMEQERLRSWQLQASSLHDERMGMV